MWRNDTKCKYVFMFPLKNLARKGLKYSKTFLNNQNHVWVFIRSSPVKTWANCHEQTPHTSPSSTDGFCELKSQFLASLDNYGVHYIDVIMTTMASQITSLTIVYSAVYLGADQRKHQSSASLAFVRNSPGPVNSPHKGPVTRKMFPFDDAINIM